MQALLPTSSDLLSKQCLLLLQYPLESLNLPLAGCLLGHTMLPLFLQLATLMKVTEGNRK